MTKYCNKYYSRVGADDEMLVLLLKDWDEAFLGCLCEEWI